MKFYSRTTPPDELNACYTYLPKDCIKIDANSVLPNCIGYVIGRWYEIFGQQFAIVGTDAHKFFDYNIQHANVFKCDAKLGAIACWDGHVAIVEDHDDKSAVFSNSHYNGERFDTFTAAIGADYHGMKFQGFLYPVGVLAFDNEYSKDEWPEYLPNDYYRVRKSWDDVSSQVGAYHYLGNAKFTASRTGLNVYSPDGKKVY